MYGTVNMSLSEKIKNLFTNLIANKKIKVIDDSEIIKIMCNYKDIANIVKIIKENEKLKFNQLTDIVAVDYPNEEKRFEVIYIFLSVTFNYRITVSVNVSEDESIDSLTSIFPSANWYEREVWDLFGITFNNHPDLRRILTDYGFNGFPLRKDFPLSGNVEVRYDLATKKVIYEPVKLAQSFRTFDFESPWIGDKSINIEKKGNE